MAVEIDPEGVETRVIHELVDFRGRDVLEIGCGDGRLTRRYADRAASVLALDPKEERIALAQRDIPDPLRSTVTFQVADATALQLPAAGFDVVVFAWSI